MSLPVGLRYIICIRHLLSSLGFYQFFPSLFCFLFFCDFLFIFPLCDGFLWYIGNWFPCIIVWCIVCPPNTILDLEQFTILAFGYYTLYFIFVVTACVVNTWVVSHFLNDIVNEISILLLYKHKHTNNAKLNQKWKRTKKKRTHIFTQKYIRVFLHSNDK